MSFVVAAIVNEPSDVLDRFVAWYQTQGAQEIWLYFDNPEHPDLAEIAKRDRVKVTRCTADFWLSLGVEPDARFTRRQNLAMTHAYHQLDAGWLLNVDADELVYAPGTTLAQWLSQKTASQTIRIRTAEYVLAPGDAQHFRLPIERKIVNDIYGSDSELFRRRLGLIGHADGKSFHRSGMSNVRLRQHWATDENGDMLVGELLTAQDGIYVLHYMAPNYEQWRAKLNWRQKSGSFPDPIKEKLRQIQSLPGDHEPQYRALFDLLHGTNIEQMDQLRQAGGLLTLGHEVPRLT